MAILQIASKFRKQFREITRYCKTIIFTNFRQSSHPRFLLSFCPYFVPIVSSPFVLSNGCLLLVTYCFSSDMHFRARLNWRDSVLLEFMLEIDDLNGKKLIILYRSSLKKKLGRHAIL